MSTCMYTAQGVIVCNKNESPKPEIVENFLNLRPNEDDSDCTSLNKQFTTIASSYNCNAVVQNNAPKCSFKFDCQEKNSTQS